MKKHNVLYTYNKILVSFKKKVNSDTCRNIWELYTKKNKPDTKAQVPYDSIYSKYPEPSIS